MQSFRFLGYQLDLRVRKVKSQPRHNNHQSIEAIPPFKLNFGPGPNWTKPDASWLNVDIEPEWGDIVINFQEFESIPLEDKSCSCVYGSHVFEHMSIFKTPLVFKEIYRVLDNDGVFRLILPDAEKSIREYVAGNTEFTLFKRRQERVKVKYGLDYTLFECMRDDFISPSGQPELLGEGALAHQNAWDFQTICAHLEKAGFHSNNLHKMGFQKSSVNYFDFEGTYPSEANQDYRSLYVEAIK